MVPHHIYIVENLSPGILIVAAPRTVSRANMTAGTFLSRMCRLASASSATNTHTRPASRNTCTSHKWWIMLKKPFSSSACPAFITEHGLNFDKGSKFLNYKLASSLGRMHNLRGGTVILIDRGLSAESISLVSIEKQVCTSFVGDLSTV